KFIIEDGVEYVTVAYANIIGIGDSEDPFKPDEIPLCVPHYMSPVIIKHGPKLRNENIYFGAESRVYNSFTTHEVRMEIIISYPARATRFEHLYDRIKIGRSFVVAGFIKFENPNIITIEATDIDYLSSFNTNYDVAENPSITSTTRTEINQIADEFRSTNAQLTKKRRKLMPTATSYSTSLTSTTPSEQSTFVNAEIATSRKGKKKVTDLALDSLGLTTDQPEEIEANEEEQYENSELENNQDQLEIIEQEKKPKKKKMQKNK
ncbi:28354_t:CDS:1, partial [Dentiscutata erythropus]